jgi:hypothetical protein
MTRYFSFPKACSDDPISDTFNINIAFGYHDPKIWLQASFPELFSK